MSLKSRYSFLQRFNFETLYNTFLGLQPKEQIYALVGVGIAVLFVIGLPVTLASSKLGGLEMQIREGREKQRELIGEIKQYQEMKADLAALEQKITEGYDATLTTTMEQLGGKSGIKDRIDNIKEKGSTSTEDYDEVSVDVRITKVTVQQLMDYFYNIEHHPKLFLRVKEVRMKRRYDNKQLLDVPTLRVSTYRLQEPEA